MMGRNPPPPLRFEWSTLFFGGFRAGSVHTTRTPNTDTHIDTHTKIYVYE